MRTFLSLIFFVFTAPAHATNCLTYDTGQIFCNNGLSGLRSQNNTYWNNGVIQYDYPSQGKSYFIGEPYPAYDTPLYDPLIEDEDNEDCLGVDCE